MSESQETPTEEQNKENENDQQYEVDVEALQTEIEQVRERSKRVAADMDNMRKRSARQVQEARQREKRDVAAAFLEVVDNLERALEVEGGGDANAWREGMQAIHKQMLDVLKGLEVQPFTSVGTLFDHHRHEAVARIPNPDHEDGIVCEEVKKGYEIGEGEILRVAQVVVAFSGQEK